MKWLTMSLLKKLSAKKLLSLSKDEETVNYENKIYTIIGFYKISVLLVIQTDVWIDLSFRAALVLIINSSLTNYAYICIAIFISYSKSSCLVRY